jgi:hypothetical protein
VRRGSPNCARKSSNDSSRPAIALAASMVMQEPDLRSHYYYPVIRLLQSGRLDIAGIRDLPPAGTAALAEELARAHTMPQKDVAAILKATEKCRKAYAKGGLHAALPLLAEVAFAGKSDSVTQMAVDVCLYYLNTPAYMLVGRQWEQMRFDLKKFAFRLAEAEMLRATPITAAPAKPFILKRA